VTTEAEPDRGAIGFAEKLFAILDEGDFTSTYKYAVILALLDLCLERSEVDGRVPRWVTTEDLARRVIVIYWPHTRSYLERGVLRQNRGGQAEILSAISKFKVNVAAAAHSLWRARIEQPKLFQRLVRKVEWTLVEYPLPRLQRVDRKLAPFIYEIGWDEGVKKTWFDSLAPAERVVRFVDQSADHLVRLAGLIRPLVQREWAERVARMNRNIVEEARLENFLFANERTALTPVRKDLADLDDGCFYCGKPLEGKGEVDHFIPWSRHPDDGIDNLVVADTSCNNRKSDRLAATDHVWSWLKRAREKAPQLREIAQRHSWEQDAATTFNAARSIYLRLPSDARLWRWNEGLVLIETERLRRILGVEAASIP
jgi:hypothetical protein